MTGTLDAVVLTDRSGRVLWANDAFTGLCGHRLTDVLGRSPGEFLRDARTDPAVSRALGRAVREGRHAWARAVNRHADGHHYGVEISLIPLRDGGNTISGFVALETEVALDHGFRQHAELLSVPALPVTPTPEDDLNAARELVRFLRDEVGGSVTLDQMHLLLEVAIRRLAGRRVEMRELTRELGLHRRTTSRYLALLGDGHETRKGLALVADRTLVEDRRAKGLELTDRGRALATRLALLIRRLCR